jgi:hypothetical protein
VVCENGLRFVNAKLPVTVSFKTKERAAWSGLLAGPESTYMCVMSVLRLYTSPKSGQNFVPLHSPHALAAKQFGHEGD